MNPSEQKTVLPVIAFATFRDGVLHAAWDGARTPVPPSFKWTPLCDHAGATEALRIAQERTEAEQDKWAEEARQQNDAIDNLRARAERLRGVLAELMALKDLKDEESRLRQRRIVATSRDLQAIEEVDAMRDDYNTRKPLAWSAARAALAHSVGSVSRASDASSQGISTSDSGDGQ
jgi:hypothetical protein